MEENGFSSILFISQFSQYFQLYFSTKKKEEKMAMERHFFLQPNNSLNLIFKDQDKEVGKLTWEDGKLTFEGNASESAQLFFDFFLKNLADEYIEKKIEGMQGKRLRQKPAS